MQQQWPFFASIRPTAVWQEISVLKINDTSFAPGVTQTAGDVVNLGLVFAAGPSVDAVATAAAFSLSLSSFDL